MRYTEEESLLKEIQIDVSVKGDVELSDDVRIKLKRRVPLLAGTAVPFDVHGRNR